MSMSEIPIRPQRDARRTRGAILSAACEAFSLQGYAAVRVRDITTAAGVNPALVSRYFGSKERLFEEALSQLLDGSLLIRTAREEFGEAMVALLTESERDRRNPLPMMLLASADPNARAIAARLLEDLVLAPLASWFGTEGAAIRAAQFAILASGFSFYREVYPLKVLTTDLDDETRAWLVGAFQSLVD